MTNGGGGRVAPLDATHDLAGFRSGVDALDRWLHVTARTAAAAGTAATYVLHDDGRIAGYYALAMGAVAHVDAPARVRRGMPDPVPAVLLARLAVADARQGEGIGGRLLVDALRRCVRGAAEFGARAVVVDAIDDRAAAFYEHFGFRPLTGGRLWRRVADIRAALGD
ncbi:GNAT family N-acetyltransferase [Patulibacter sp. S7RM1-6]